MSKQSLSYDELTPLLFKALDASASGIIITDNRQPDNPIIYSNQAFVKMTGYSSDEIIGRNCRFLQGADKQQEAREKIREAVRQGKDISIEIRNYTKDDQLFWNELVISPIRDDHGDVTHFIGVQNDVTHRKQVEEDLRREREFIEQKVDDRTAQLRMNEEYLDSIIQTVREGLVVLDRDLRVLTVNHQFLDKFKVSLTETVGNLFYELGNGQWDIADLRNLLENILPTNNPVLDFEVEHDFPYIGKKTMLLNAHRIENEGHYKDRILLAIEDITDRRIIEKRKDDFLSIASHELKTPLTAIKGYIQLIDRLLGPDIDRKLADILHKSKTQIERLNALISELLDVSKIQSGKLALHHAPFDFDRMVRDTVEHIQLTTEQHEITLTGSTSVTFLGDEVLLSQVVGNLLSNAIKYSPDATRVMVHLAMMADKIKVSVKDYGLGISQDDQHNVFERFFRVNEVQTRYPGMGIGLFICAQILKQHGGSLWVDSELGKGSTFSFTLPRQQSTTP
ncbi:sensor histidine kinase [Sphingobacterium suaedae]|uniref:histidine kinase n=1 Tax=Sphingobacterium suaedae TaxID=1686402 RepID=A0ABW5KE30_9SPHI